MGVWGVPRVVEASMSGDWGELSMWQAVSAFWYCCRVIWKMEAQSWVEVQEKLGRALPGPGSPS